MKTLICPDSYKESLTSIQVAQAIAKGFSKQWPEEEQILIPLADGGEGTVMALVQATKGEIHYQWVSDPLNNPVDAYFGILGNGSTAVVEVAQASGLALLSAEKRNPMLTTSYGTGELIVEALDKGCKKLVLALGGSATNDGGMGLLTALGINFYDQDGQILSGNGRDLARVARIDASGLDGRLKDVEVQVACDVSNPLCGKNGAAHVYGAQKGATEEMIVQLDSGLENYARVIAEQIGKKVRDMPGAGAAGGIGAGALAFLNAKLVSGVDLLIETTGIEEIVPQVDLIVTGEGRTDEQTANGKAPMGISKLAKKYGKPVICISGSVDLNSEKLLTEGFDAMFSVLNEPMDIDAAMANSYSLVENTANQVARLLDIARS